MTDQELMNELQELTVGLTWMSESDYPCEPFSWEEIDPNSFQAQDLLHHIGYAPNTPLEIQSLEEFFTPAIQEQDWHNEAEQAQVKRYQALMNFLKDNLNNIQVYKVAKVEIDVYILGKTTNGNLDGVKTKVIET